jgi:hypothetical protein
MTEAEILERNKAAISALDTIDDMGDEEEQGRTLEALIKAIDSDPLSYRKKFG